MFNNINYRRIKEVFIRMNWGFVERVYVVQMRGFERGYVHFAASKWNVGEGIKTKTRIKKYKHEFPSGQRGST